jgi:eukaryotic translation initiation factor 2C
MGCTAAAVELRVASYSPRLTLIVLQKRGNQRVMPAMFARDWQRARAQDLNVPPGTCIETGIVHPVYEEFILVAHKAIQVS